MAGDAGTVVLGSAAFPTSTDEEQDGEKRKERKEKKVAAILHESVPVRFWDSRPRPDRAAAVRRHPRRARATDPPLELTDLTPDAGRALERSSYDVSADGSTVVTTWDVPERGGLRTALALIDVATGERRTLLDDADSEYQVATIQPRREPGRGGPPEAVDAARPG